MGCQESRLARDRHGWDSTTDTVHSTGLPTHPILCPVGPAGTEYRAVVVLHKALFIPRHALHGLEPGPARRESLRGGPGGGPRRGGQTGGLAGGTLRVWSPFCLYRRAALNSVRESTPYYRVPTVLIGGGYSISSAVPMRADTPDLLAFGGPYVRPYLSNRLRSGPLV